MTEKQIETFVLEDKLFGVVEVDLEVPQHLREQFSEMPPIFRNAMLSREDIGAYMKEFAETHGIMSTPRRSLIGSFVGKKILLASPLLKWYLQHGLVVTCIYQVVEYTPKACFEKFGMSVCDARRDGDRDESKAIIADTMKLLGKSIIFSYSYTDVLFRQDHFLLFI
jgi:hypothetical protein